MNYWQRYPINIFLQQLVEKEQEKEQEKEWKEEENLYQLTKYDKKDTEMKKVFKEILAGKVGYEDEE